MTQELMTIEQDRFLPALSMQQAIQRRDALVAFVKQIMIPGVDYGRIPGTDKDTLYKPGAERLCSFFGLTPDFQVVKEIEDWDANEPLFYYRYKCRLLRDGRVIGDGEGSCNSRESKYRWRWVDAADVPPGLDTANLPKRGGVISEFTFAVDKAETGGKYGKPVEYWQKFHTAIESGAARQIKKKIKSGELRDAWEIDSTVYRIPNDDIASLINTIQKMAQKRAFIGACLIAVNASEYFTQDLDDLPQPAVSVMQEASYAAPTLDTLRTELKRARERLRTLGGEPRPLSKQQAEGMDGAALAAEILDTNNAAWELAMTEIATARSQAQAKAQAEADELFPDKMPAPKYNGMPRAELPL